jgi:hypothetical protein
LDNGIYCWLLQYVGRHFNLIGYFYNPFRTCYRCFLALLF